MEQSKERRKIRSARDRRGMRGKCEVEQGQTSGRLRWSRFVRIATMEVLEVFRGEVLDVISTDPRVLLVGVKTVRTKVGIPVVSVRQLE